MSQAKKTVGNWVDLQEALTAAFAMAELGATTRIYEPLLLSVHSILGSRGLANGL
jgi:hypothetical protein